MTENIESTVKPTDEETSSAAAKAREGSRQAESDAGKTSQKDLVADLAGSTTRIVNKAAAILEEEIAIGIKATQDLEKKYIDVEELRAQDPESVIQRFRKDAHDVVDILIDLVNVTTNAVGSLTERGVSIGIGSRAQKPERKKEAGAVIPSLEYPSQVQPGEAVEIPMTLENESDDPTDEISFYCSDLVSTDGSRISSRRITFSPETLIIEPRGSALVTVVVEVPEKIKPGLYSGLLQAAFLHQLRAVLSLQIS